MANFSRLEVLNNFYKAGIVPVFYNNNDDEVLKIVDCLYEADLRVIEFTNRGSFAHRIFEKIAEHRKRNYPDLALGIGSVIDAPTAALYLQLDADFVVSPLLDESVIKICNQRKVAVLPGCTTLSEIQRAEALGVEIVKLFPAVTSGGAGFIKNVSGPCPWTTIMPTGGITLAKEDLESWFKAGAVCVGVGSNLFVKDKTGNFNYEETKTRIRQALDIIDSLTNRK
jgi:2-dehydro-3-deoxyphosphogluconate aldolase/(4S)-4-hydroxy-2-oxoglutarate aldolase